jgi:hypothetical protein
MSESSGRDGRGSVPPTSGASEAPGPDVVRRARRLTAIAFLTVVIGWVGVAAAQIIKQAFAPEVLRGPWPSCVEGLQALSGSLDRGMTAAEAETDSERGIAAFRAAVEPEWRYVEGVRATCTRDDERRGLDALERLRYAEEHSVRREAASLAPIRKQADKAIEGLSPRR